jgi:hypothetical protein
VSVPSAYLSTGRPGTIVIQPIENFNLSANQATCNAPGYDFNVTGIYCRLVLRTTPAGWSVVTTAACTWASTIPAVVEI